TLTRPLNSPGPRPRFLYLGRRSFGVGEGKVKGNSTESRIQLTDTRPACQPERSQDRHACHPHRHEEGQQPRSTSLRGKKAVGSPRQRSFGVGEGNSSSWGDRRSHSTLSIGRCFGMKGLRLSPSFAPLWRNL